MKSKACEYTYYKVWNCPRVFDSLVFCSFAAITIDDIKHIRFAHHKKSYFFSYRSGHHYISDEVKNAETISQSWMLKIVPKGKFLDGQGVKSLGGETSVCIHPFETHYWFLAFFFGDIIFTSKIQKTGQFYNLHLSCNVLAALWQLDLLAVINYDGTALKMRSSDLFRNRTAFISQTSEAWHGTIFFGAS